MGLQISVNSAWLASRGGKGLNNVRAKLKDLQSKLEQMIYDAKQPWLFKKWRSFTREDAEDLFEREGYKLFISREYQKALKEYKKLSYTEELLEELVVVSKATDRDIIVRGRDHIALVSAIVARSEKGAL